MIKLQEFSDKAAISLSLLCAVHCLALPVFLILFPSMASLGLNNEALHFWVMLAVIPTSVYALTLGCKQHKRMHLLVVGLIGLIFLLFAVSIPASLLGETGEKVFTLLGSGLIAFGHFRNYRLCQHSQSCACPEHNAASKSSK